MKVYKLEVFIIDHDDLKSDEIAAVVTNTRYPNRCISPEVIDIQECDIGEWSDDLDLNQTKKWRTAYSNLKFSPIEKPDIEEGVTS